MKPESEKYRKVIDLLRESKPMLDSTDDIEREVIKRITKASRYGLSLSEAVDFLFGWVYIGWVRRGLIAASVVLILVFVIQQGVILKRIDMLGKQTVVVEKGSVSTPVDEIERLLVEYRNSGKRFPARTVTLSEQQLKELLESIKELKIKHKDLENLIDTDPELKKLIEKKLIEYNRTKINL